MCAHAPGENGILHNKHQRTSTARTHARTHTICHMPYAMRHIPCTLGARAHARTSSGRRWKCTESWSNIQTAWWRSAPSSTQTTAVHPFATGTAAQGLTHQTCPAEGTQASVQLYHPQTCLGMSRLPSNQSSVPSTYAKSACVRACACACVEQPRATCQYGSVW